jgi:hypothetical protein
MISGLLLVDTPKGWTRFHIETNHMVFLIAQAKRRDVLSGCSFPIITGVTC